MVLKAKGIQSGNNGVISECIIKNNFGCFFSDLSRDRLVSHSSSGTRGAKKKDYLGRQHRPMTFIWVGSESILNASLKGKETGQSLDYLSQR